MYVGTYTTLQRLDVILYYRVMLASRCRIHCDSFGLNCRGAGTHPAFAVGKKRSNLKTSRLVAADLMLQAWSNVTGRTGTFSCTQVTDHAQTERCGLRIQESLAIDIHKVNMHGKDTLV